MGICLYADTYIAGGKRKTVTIEDFDMLKVLGRGTFGKVRGYGCTPKKY